MSAWAGKYVIGLTGNIATGKSVVRKMLEHLGAYGIDADALAHRAIARDAPGYQAVVEMFGKWIVGADGQIDRGRLGRVVFSDAEALEKLEMIVHPLVGQAVDLLVRRANHEVIVIEAIKLIEAGLSRMCDSLWVSYAPQEVQLRRLQEKRGMSAAAARLRIEAQPPQEAKVAAADVVIRNVGSFEDTWRQVAAAWQNLPVTKVAARAARPARGALRVERARPKDAAEIARLINQMSAGERQLSRADVMAAFGEKAFLVLKQDSQALAVAGWKVENLVAATDDVYVEPAIPVAEALKKLMEEVEQSSQALQCEVSLLFLPPGLAGEQAMLSALGYQTRSVQSLGVRAWQEAAIESMPKGTVMLVKQLRQDRVLRPV